MRLSGSHLTFSNVETHSIKAIEFGLMNPEDIVNIILNFKIYENLSFQKF